MTSSASRKRSDLAFLLAFTATALLLVCELIAGTSFYFALCVFLSLIIVVVTLRIIHLGSVAGILIAALEFRYLAFSQVMRTWSGEPADGDLLVPNTTITVILVGTFSICAAAILVHALLGRRKIIPLRYSTDKLAVVRNLSLAFGLVFELLHALMSQGTDGNGPQYGFVNGLSTIMGNLIYFAVYVETWRTLEESDGERSTSLTLYWMAGPLTVWGFYANSKLGVALPFLAYLMAAVIYQRRITKQQTLALAAVVIGGMLLVGPGVEILRSERNPLTGYLTTDQVIDFAERMVTDPESIRQEWARLKMIQASGDSLFNTQHYLGNSDILERFAFISITDTIVNAVNEDGPYGWGLVSDGVAQIFPTFLNPDKPRNGTGDLMTWHYGLRSYGVTGNIATGIFADSYALAEWPGIFLAPFVLVFLFLLGVQSGGTSLRGNFVGAYFVIAYFHAFTEQGVAGLITIIFREVPVVLVFLAIIFYLAESIGSRRALAIIAGRLPSRRSLEEDEIAEHGAAWIEDR